MMYYNGNGHMSGWGWALMGVGMVVFWGLLIAAGLALFRYLGQGPQQATPGASHSTDPEQILAARYARGEIDTAEYHDRLASLRGRVTR